MRPVCNIGFATLLVGCSPDLVRGGTASQREVVFATLDEIESATGKDISLSSVSFRDVSRGAGKYNSVTRKISLDSTLTGDPLVRAMRHELCHALDFQFDFGSPSHPEWRIDATALQYGSRRRQAREAFAATCGVAPADSAAVMACGTSPLDPELDRMLSELFTETPRVTPLAPLWTGETTLPVGETMRFVGITDIGNLRIHGTSTFLKVDLLGNEAPTGIGDSTLDSEPVSDQMPGAWRFPGGLRLAGGTLAGVAEFNLPDGTVLRQMMIMADETSFQATACATTSDLWFEWEDEVWLVRQEGTVVKWGPLVSVQD